MRLTGRHENDVEVEEAVHEVAVEAVEHRHFGRQHKNAAEQLIFSKITLSCSLTKNVFLHNDCKVLVGVAKALYHIYRVNFNSF